MFEHWIILVIIAGIASVLFNIVNRQFLRNGHDSTVYAWLFVAIRSVFFIFLIPLDTFILPNLNTLLILLFLGLSELGAVYLYMKMHAATELSVSGILVRLRVLLVPIFAFIFLGEHLTPIQYLGITTIFTGCLVIVGMKRMVYTKGIWYGIGFVVLSAISSILLKSASGVASVTVVNVAYSLPAAILIPLLMKNSIARLRLSVRAIFKPTLLASAFNIITMYTLVRAFQLASASQVTGIFQAVSALSVLVGIIFLQERDHIFLKIAGATLTTIGIILLV